MKLQRFHPRFNGYGFAGMHEREDGGFCATKDVEAMEAENAALHAECDRLTALLQWEQNRRERIGTHGDECWKWGPAHYECASRETERLTAMLGPQKVLSAEEVAKPGFYWHRYGTEEWCVVDVDFGYPYGRLFIWANGEQDDGLEGQFIGPIKMPEV